MTARNLKKLCCSSGCRHANGHHHCQALANSLWKQEEKRQVFTGKMKRNSQKLPLARCAQQCLGNIYHLQLVHVSTLSFLRNEQQCFLGQAPLQKLLLCIKDFSELTLFISRLKIVKFCYPKMYSLLLCVLTQGILNL